MLLIFIYLQIKEPENAKPEGNVNKAMHIFTGNKNKDNAGTFECSISGLFSCLMCTHSKGDKDNLQLVEISNSLNQLSKKLDDLEKVSQKTENVDQMQTEQPKITPLEDIQTAETYYMDTHDASDSDTKSIISDTFEMEPNNWLEEEELGQGEYNCIPTKEKQFWEGVLDKYLHPIEDNKEKVIVKKECLIIKLICNVIYCVGS